MAFGKFVMSIVDHIQDEMKAAMNVTSNVSWAALDGSAEALHRRGYTAARYLGQLTGNDVDEEKVPGVSMRTKKIKAADNDTNSSELKQALNIAYTGEQEAVADFKKAYLKLRDSLLNTVKGAGETGEELV